MAIVKSLKSRKSTMRMAGLLSIFFLTITALYHSATSAPYYSKNSLLTGDDALHLRKRNRRTKISPTATVNDLWYHVFDCEKIFKKPRPIHNQETWLHMRKVYRHIVGLDETDVSKSGWNVPFDVKLYKKKGRGVSATKLIPKGTLVWSAAPQSARFTTGSQYRKFLSHLRPDVACDVIQWAYVIKLDPSKKANDASSARIGVDLDEGSLMNTASDKKANVACPTDERCTSDMKLFAVRDIQPGEEILCHYGDFVVSHGWKWFGL